MNLSFPLLAVLATFAFQSGLSAEEADIVELSQRHPLVSWDLNNRPIPYGDEMLGDAIHALAGIPHPWTVPKMIGIFETERRALSEKDRGQRRIGSEPHSQEWERLRHIARLLAASRDPRATVVLEEALDSQDGLDHGLLHFELVDGLFNYFALDPTYQFIPARPMTYQDFDATNFFPVEEEILKFWRTRNDKELRARAAAATAAASAGK